MGMLKRSYIYILLLGLSLLSCGKENDPDNGNGTPADDTTPPKEYTISGTVSGDDGALLQGVVVSDGVHCVKTNSKGKYYISSDIKATDYVFVSTPSGYAAPVMEGHACFWKFLTDCTPSADGKYTIDFALKKISNPERFTVFIYADPQPRKSSAGLDKLGYHSLDCCSDMYRDMRELAATMRDRPVYGIGLGDIVHQDLTLLPVYRQGMTTTGITTYNVIGNHDHGHRLMEDALASKDYEAIMGPANFSFNLGGMHFLMLDNMISGDPAAGKYCDECTTGLTDAIWEWVQNDLAQVSVTTPLMVCAHSPMMRGFNDAKTGGKDRSGLHVGDLKNLLSKYTKAYVWAGHTHATYNYVDKANPGIESHTLSRVTGALWSNDYLGSNGTPRGYVVFEYDHGEISWSFKPTFYQSGSFVGTYGGGDGTPPAYVWRDWNYVGGKAVLKTDGKDLDASYQMQLFPPGTYGDAYLYANIFLWDELWQMPRFVSGGEQTPMKRVTDNDFRYSFSDWEITSFYNKIIPSEFIPSKNNTDSMFRVYVDSAHGSGKVTVRDRFGNEHSSTITW